MFWKDAIYYENFDFTKLRFSYVKSNKRGKNAEYCQKEIITFDTETSKYTDDILFITDWSITIQDNACIYGHNVKDLIYSIDKIVDQVVVNDITKCIIYCHNFQYDYMFIRNHALKQWGIPEKSLATKPHKYIFMTFGNRLEFRDSYILTHKSLEKLCIDMGVTQKASGKWDYKKFRTPNSGRTENEMEYMLTDTIALNEALIKFMELHKVNNATCQYTSTGFIRRRGLEEMYHNNPSWNKKGFREQKLTLEQYKLLTDVYHGGYTHANRYYINTIVENVESYDFVSSYPSVMCYERFPMSGFTECDNVDIDTILDTKEYIAYCGYLCLTNVRIKKLFPMPLIQSHKTKFELNTVYDNGKLISADYVVFPFSDPDLDAILEAYTYDVIEVGKCMFAEKDYLPDFITRDLIMPLFKDKCTLKNKDEVNYMLSKEFINGIYGMCVQKIIPDEAQENFCDGLWHVEKSVENVEKAETTLNKFYKNHSKYLEYQWGVYVTAYAQANLFKFAKCVKEWIYSDTDSIKAIGVDYEAIERYNADIKEKAKKRNIGIVEHDGKEYILGIAEKEKNYDTFITLGSKRYCYEQDNEIHITVAGVPKKAAIELKKIEDFKRGFIFCKKSGDIEKLTAVYILNDGIKEIEIDNEIIEYGCAVRLDRVEYLLDSAIPYDKDTGLPLNIDFDKVLEEY